MHFEQLKRREFIALLGGAAAAWPLAVRAQQTAMPVVGFLRTTLPDARLTAAFRDGLNEAGYIEGQNVAIEYRWAENQLDRLATLAGDLVRRQVAVIFAAGNSAASAASAATTTIPIVAAVGDDPVSRGLVRSLNRPEANVTGVSFFSGAELQAKRLELLRMLVPHAKAIALLADPNNPNTADHAREARKALHADGIQLRVLGASSETDIETAFTTLARERISALLIAGDAFFTSHHRWIVSLVERHRILALYNIREYAAAGGLMSYGASQTDTYRRAALYVGKVLKGAKISDLPFMLPTKYDLVINLKAANAQGLTLPTALLALADEVIE
jgi:putative tryptophan/tyrosine transport system substrate-binding protein